MPRNPLGAFVFYSLGFIVTAAGSVIVGLAALALFDPARARMWLVELLAFTPVKLTSPMERIAFNMTEDRPVVLLESVIGAFVLASGLSILYSGRKAMRPANQSLDDKFAVVLDGPARVGQVLAGRLAFLTRPDGDQVYRIELACVRDYTTESENHGRDVAVARHLNVRPKLNAGGWSLPFSFEIPATAPASRAIADDEWDVYHWRMTVSRPGRILSRDSRLTLRVAADPNKPRAFEPLTDGMADEAWRAVREMDPRLRRSLFAIVAGFLLFCAGIYVVFRLT